MRQKVILEPGRAGREYLKDLWRYRELLYVLSWRDLSVRYKQTAVGVAWAVLRPALTALVFTVIFGKLGSFPSEGAPYAVMVLAGMLPWQLFSAGLSESGTSLVTNAALITKVYFPRVIIPASALFTSFVDFCIAALILFGLMAWYGQPLTARIVCLPAFAALAVVAAAGVGIWISALNVKYRDFAYVVPFITQLGLYVSPVGYSSSIVPQRWRLLYHLNPMASVIDGFRWCVLGGPFASRPEEVALGVGVMTTVFLTGVLYFRRTEREFADLI
jgi:lipopolysaccharide transport system permease protein